MYPLIQEGCKLKCLQGPSRWVNVWAFMVRLLGIVGTGQNGGCLKVFRFTHTHAHTVVAQQKMSVCPIQLFGQQYGPWLRKFVSRVSLLVSLSPIWGSLEDKTVSYSVSYPYLHRTITLPRDDWSEMLQWQKNFRLYIAENATDNCCTYYFGGCYVWNCMSKRAHEWAQKPTLCLTQPHST